MLLIFVSIIQSCQKDKLEKITTELQKHREIILSKDLNNPYTLENMNKAIDILKENDPLANDIEIKVTHKYIRFLPKDSLEYKDLISDENLILFSYPLLNKIEQAGQFYHDKNLAKNQITWQYTVVPFDYILPEVKFELLSDVFLPSKIRQNAEIDMQISLAKLEDIALKLVGIEDKQIKTTNKTNAYNWYKPKCTVKIAGSFNEPVIDAKLVVNHLLNIDWTHTGQSGVGIIANSFLYEVQYKLFWHPKNSLFRLSYAALTLYHIGPYQNTDWIFNIYPNSANDNLTINHAMVYLAAHDFMYKPSIRGAITLPSRPDFTTDIVVDNYNTATGFSTSNAAFANINIVIMFTAGNLIQESYTVTIHELGHMSHSVGAQANYNEMGMEYNNPNNLARVAIEAWAEGVEWYICKQKYLSSYGINDINTKGLYIIPLIGNKNIRIYNQIVYDLIDNDNEGREDITSFVFNDPDLFKFHEGAEFSVSNGTIYYTKNPLATTQAELCPILGSYLDNNGLCNLMPLPTDPLLEYEITQNGHVINFFSWEKATPYTNPMDTVNIMPYDRVSGYAISEIQDALYDATTWHEWRDNMENINNNNPTKQYVNELFSNWF